MFSKSYHRLDCWYSETLKKIHKLLSNDKILLVCHRSCLCRSCLCMRRSDGNDGTSINDGRSRPGNIMALVCRHPGFSLNKTLLGGSSLYADILVLVFHILHIFNRLWAQRTYNRLWGELVTCGKNTGQVSAVLEYRKDVWKVVENRRVSTRTHVVCRAAGPGKGVLLSDVSTHGPTWVDIEKTV